MASAAVLAIAKSPWLSTRFSISNTPCTSALNCSLNGVCNQGVCHCDKPWSGAACSSMNFKPVTFPQGYGMKPKLTSWGGNLIYDSKTNTHHMFVSRMSNGCKLNAFMNNSRIDHAVSSTGPEGPYAFQDVAVNTFSHNAAPVKLKDGTYAIFHVGLGNGLPDGGNNCTAPSSQTSPISASVSAAQHGDLRSQLSEGHIAMGVHVSRSLSGPWTLTKTGVNGCNNPAVCVYIQPYKKPHPSNIVDERINLSIFSFPWMCMTVCDVV